VTTIFIAETNLVFKMEWMLKQILSVLRELNKKTDVLYYIIMCIIVFLMFNIRYKMFYHIKDSK